MIAAGVVFGLALDTKHNAWFLPAVLVPHALWVFLSRALRERRIVVPGSLFAMALIGPAVLVLLWPYLWHDTRARIEWWMNFHLHHEYYNIEFLGKNYFGPPSPKSDVPVMVAATVPGITLLLFLIGSVERLRVAGNRLRSWILERVHFPADGPSMRDPRETDLLLALSIAIAMGPFFLPSTPIFGGDQALAAGVSGPRDLRGTRIRPRRACDAASAAGAARSAVARGAGGAGRCASSSPRSRSPSTLTPSGSRRTCRSWAAPPAGRTSG